MDGDEVIDPMLAGDDDELELGDDDLDLLGGKGLDDEDEDIDKDAE